MKYEEDDEWDAQLVVEKSSRSYAYELIKTIPACHAKTSNDINDYEG